MNIEIDYEVASTLANNVMMQDYNALQGEGYYSGDDGSLEELLEAYRVVMSYCTTNEERQAQGIVL